MAASKELVEGLSSRLKAVSRFLPFVLSLPLSLSFFLFACFSLSCLLYCFSSLSLSVFCHSPSSVQ